MTRAALIALALLLGPSSAWCSSCRAVSCYSEGPCGARCECVRIRSYGAGTCVAKW
jgi:hypothetical protein